MHSHEPIEPWHQQPAETDTAYTAFQAYLDLPPSGRTIIAAWRAVNPTHRDIITKKAPPSNWITWKRKHNWDTRTREYDQRARDHTEQRRRLLLDTAIAMTQNEIESLQQAIHNIALGYEKADPVRLKALVYQLRMCGYDPDLVLTNMARASGDIQETATKIMLYLPDNGRGPNG